MSDELTYSKYLKIRQLLELQQPLSEPAEHDEMLFIVIHQVYELWFKLMLHEMEKLKRNFSDGHTYSAISTLKRVRMVMKTLVQQLDVLETMNSMSFRAFRDRLETASGFQSVQFRELEFVLGHKRSSAVTQFKPATGWREVLEKRMEEPSIIDHFYLYLGTQGVEVPKALLERDVTAPSTADEELQDKLVELYHAKRDVRILLELMTDFDQGLQEWRYRHVKMVERTIGTQFGTGGSPGVTFLKTTLFQSVFPDLWAIRAKL